MVRKYTPSAGETTHVTIRCNNKEFLFDLEKNFDGMVSWINCLPGFFKVRLHHVLFMSNHMHLLLTPQENNLGQALSYFLTNLSKYLNYSLVRSDHIFGARYRPTVIKDNRHLVNVIRYIYQNPVRAGIVSSVRDYPYSSLEFYLRAESRGLFLHPDTHTRKMFDFGINGLVSWLTDIDSMLADGDLNVMRKSTKRRVFKLTRGQYQSLQNSTLSFAK